MLQKCGMCGLGVCVGWGYVWVGGMCGLGVRPMFFLRANKYVVLGAVLLMR